MLRESFGSFAKNTKATGYKDPVLPFHMSRNARELYASTVTMVC